MILWCELIAVSLSAPGVSFSYPMLHNMISFHSTHYCYSISNIIIIIIVIIDIILYNGNRGREREREREQATKMWELLFANESVGLLQFEPLWSLMFDVYIDWSSLGSMG